MPGIEVVDISDFETRKDEIRERLWKAATEVGFIYVTGHGFAPEEVARMFELGRQYFEQPIESKKRNLYQPGEKLGGWSAGAASLDESGGLRDNREVYYFSFRDMGGLLPSESVVPGFAEDTKRFMAKLETVTATLLSCFALKLGFPEHFFDQHLDSSKDDCTKLLMFTRYPSVEGQEVPKGQWRCGQHTDYGCLTLLFQRGERGLQVCPGREVDGQWETGAHVEGDLGWSEVPPIEGTVLVNIGDSLMRWSDGQLQSTLHRVRFPLHDEPQGDRYSLVFFNQVNKSSIIEGPLKKYPPISAGDYLAERINRIYH